MMVADVHACEDAPWPSYPAPLGSKPHATEDNASTAFDWLLVLQGCIHMLPRPSGEGLGFRARPHPASSKLASDLRLARTSRSCT